MWEHAEVWGQNVIVGLSQSTVLRFLLRMKTERLKRRVQGMAGLYNVEEALAFPYARISRRVMASYGFFYAGVREPKFTCHLARGTSRCTREIILFKVTTLTQRYPRSRHVLLE